MKELNRLIPYLKNYRRLIYPGLIFVTLSNIASTIVPRYIGSTIDSISVGNFTSQLVLVNIAIILSLTAFAGLMMFFTRKTIIVASRNIEYDLRRDFLQSIELRNMRFFNTTPTGTLMAYATNDITAAREFLGPAVMFSVNSITTFIFALYFMLSINVPVTLVSLMPLPAIAVATYFIGKKIHIAFRDVQSQFADMTAEAQEAFSGIRVIRSFGREAYEQGKFSALSMDYFAKNMRLAKIQSIIMPVIMVLVGFSLLIVLIYGGLEVIHKNLTLGELTQFFIYTGLLIWPVAAIGWITNLVQRAAASAERLGKVLDHRLPETETKKNTPVPTTTGIEFNNVWMNYDQDLPYVLRDVTFRVEDGSSLGIVGVVGSGKSSVISILTGLIKIDQGEAKIGGIPVADISLENLAGIVGTVPQDPFLFSTSILENIKFGKSDATMEEVLTATKIACLHDEILTFPDQYDTMLGERGITLSGGQKQRLAIARAVIKDPGILILDDALSSVDSETESRILKNLLDFMKGRTTVIISHRVSTVMNSTKIITLEGGFLIEQGSHEELLAKGGKYAEMFSIQKLEEELDRM